MTLPGPMRSTARRKEPGRPERSEASVRFEFQYPGSIRPSAGVENYVGEAAARADGAGPRLPRCSAVRPAHVAALPPCPCTGHSATRP